MPLNTFAETTGHVSLPKEPSAPDWDVIAEDVRCPLCDYNLRGLAQPRCPECGYRFDWPDLLDPTRRLHPYLFEHHPERNIWSFRKSLVAGLRPRRFWKSLSPVQPSHPRRLLGYWLILVAFFTASLAFPFVASVVRISRQNAGFQAWQRSYYNAVGQVESKAWIIREYGSVDAYLEYNQPTAFSAVAREILVHEYHSSFYTSIVLIGAWPWLTAMALLIFRKTLNHARLNSIHVLRCSIYSFDTLIWVAGAIVLVVPGTFLFSTPRPTSFLISLLSELGPFIAFLLCLLFASYRLFMAFRYYLKLDKPASVVFATQIIVLLAMANIFALFALWLFPPPVG